MPDFELVIFDCDGVLLDSEIIACAADADAYSQLGFQISMEEVARRFAGMPDEAVDAVLANELGKPLPPQFRSQIKRTVLKKYRTELRVIEGAGKLLSKLKISKCIASSASPAKLALGLVETELYELVYPNIFSAQLVERGKPHPDIFQYAANKMNVPAKRCVVIEDSVAGVTAACAAGMDCIGFTGGSHCFEDHSERLKDAGANYVVGRLDEILSIVE